MNRTIIIMTKVPRAGNVKTRLQPFLSAEQCTTLAEAFLADAIEKTRGVCDSLIVAFAPSNEKNYFARFDFENTILVEQRGADLGEKMLNAFEFAFELNSDASAAVMIGTDSPTLPVEFIERAFEFLESSAEMVLGEAEDGGFYLIGLRKNCPQLFENVEWSSPRVFEQTTRNVERLKINLKLVPSWFDVDAPEDLRRLREEIIKSETTQKIAPQTFRWLKEHSNVFDKNSNL